jgi:hypothetical protein
MSLLHELYTDPAHPAGFSSIERLFLHAREQNPKVKREEVEEFLTHMDPYTLYRRNPRRFPRLKFKVKAPHRILSVDIADMIRVEKHNDGYRYALVGVDTFSRFAWMIPLKTKSGVEVAKTLEEHIFKPVPYPRLHVDKGKEFYNTTVQDMLRRYDSRLYSTYGSNTHAVHAERCIRTLKGRLFRWMNFNNTWRWIEVVPKIVEAYNHATHRAFKNKYTPYQVHYQPELAPIIRDMMNEVPKPRGRKGKKIVKRKGKKILKPGSTVRLSQLQSIFAKEQYPMNSEEIFRVKTSELKENIPVYRLEDLKNDPVPGLFYHNDLVPTAEKDLYVIDQILKTRGKGKKKQFFVSYVGYPSSFNEWITQKQLEKI